MAINLNVLIDLPDELTEEEKVIVITELQKRLAEDVAFLSTKRFPNEHRLVKPKILSLTWQEGRKLPVVCREDLIECPL